MSRPFILAAAACFPLVSLLSGCAPMHDSVVPLKEQAPAAAATTRLPPALAAGWPQSQWWQAYHDPQLNALIERALAHAPDMQVAEQRIHLAEAQAQRVAANEGPQVDFSADVERQRMSAEGLMGPFAITDPAAGTTGPWYTNGTFGLTAGWDLDLWGKNRDEVAARIGNVRAHEAERQQTRQLLATSVARLYWQWQTEAAISQVLDEIDRDQQTIVAADRQLHQAGITSSVADAENSIDEGKTRQQQSEARGKMRVIEARLIALTDRNAATLHLQPVVLPKVEGKMPAQLGYDLLARRPDLQAAQWYIESSLSSVEAAKAAF